MPNKKSFTFTIFTPCYNSEQFIHRVFESLNRQTFRDFEWIVVNDASSDNTSNLIKDFIKTADFEIQFFDLDKNQMLTKNFNLAIKNARGRFFIPAGHDDEFISNTLETFLTYWDQNGSEKSSGISCLCQDQNGHVVGDQFPESPFISDYFDVVYNKKIKGEKWGFTRTDVMREFMLPEDIDVYISEGLIWAGIGSKYNTIYINEILRTYYIDKNQQSLSFLNKKKFHYIEGQQYLYKEMINKYLRCIKGNTKVKTFYFINYIRMSIHLQIDVFQIIKDVTCIQHKIALICLIPAGYAISLRDILQKRI